MAILLIFVLVLDQASKQFMLNWIFAHRGSIRLCLFSILFPYGTRVSALACSLMEDLGCSRGADIFAFAVVGWFFWQANRLDHVQQIAAGLISGGAIGNAIDRLRFGKVVDFIDVYVQTWHWPAFNVADAAITVGAALWAYSIFFGQRRSGMKSSATNQKPIRRVLQFTMLLLSHP